MTRKHRRRSVCLHQSLAAIQLLEPRTLFSSWTTVSLPTGVHNSFLLTDGRIMAQDQGNQDYYLLSPTSTGSYGSVSSFRTADSISARLYYGSAVLKDGRVIVSGGEYGTGNNHIEIYDPSLNTWTAIAKPSFLTDGITDNTIKVLPNGNVLMGTGIGGELGIYNPTTNTWTQAASYPPGWLNEVSMAILADGSVFALSTGGTGGTDQGYRYVPSVNQWYSCGTSPVALNTGEGGPMVQLQDGKLFMVGDDQGGLLHTAIYTPPTTQTGTGTWAATANVPVTPVGLEADAPLAALPNGDVLVPAQDSTSNSVLWFTYNEANNAFTAVPNVPSGVSSATWYYLTTLALPTGQIWVTTGANTAWMFNPDGSAPSTALPIVNSVVHNSDGSYTVAGTQLTGITEGGMYGDDVQQSTNYPIVQLTSGSNVYFAKTYNPSTTAVGPSTTTQTFNFTLPLGIPSGTYSLRVMASGISSAATSITVPALGTDAAPTIATAALATPSPVTGTTVNLSVLGADDGGETNLTYTWITTSAPSGYGSPCYSVNGTNAAKNTTVTFHDAGSYSFKVYATDAYGLSTTSTVSVTVNQTLTSATITPAKSTISTGATDQLSVSALDQFGNAMAVQPSFNWSLAGGTGSISTAGLYQSFATGTLALVNASSGAITANASIGVVTSPWTSQEIGTPAITGIGYDNGFAGTLTMQASGNDIWNSSDNFHYTYQSVTGNATIIAKINTLPIIASDSTQVQYSKAGVMFRDSNAANASFIHLSYTNSVGVEMTMRDGTGTGAFKTGGSITTGSFEYVKLVRAGTTYTGYASPDGNTWTQVASYTTSNISNTALCGVDLTSHDDTRMVTETFSNIVISNPSLATAAAANPGSVTGTKTRLSVLGANTPNPNGESSLTYTWAATTIPSGATAPTFSTNGTNAAKNTIATFTSAGSYTFTVAIADAYGQSVTSMVNVTVAASLTAQVLTSVSITPATSSITAAQTDQLTATAYDQFGIPMQNQPTFTWALSQGNGNVNSSGLYTAPASGTLATVTATAGALSSSAKVGVVNSPWTSIDIGSPGFVGNAWDSAGTITLQGSGNDIWNNSDQFHFDYQSVNGSAQIVATFNVQVVNTDSTQSFAAKGGVMFRDNSAANASFVQMVYTNGIGIQLLYRNGSGVSAAQSGSNIGYSGTLWVKLVRSGSTYTGSYSSNGTTWTTLASMVDPYIGSTALVGVVACSHDNTKVAQIAYTNVAISQVTVATAAAANPSPVTGTTTNLSVLGSDPAGESTLTYTWAASNVPSGATTPIFSINGTNAAKNTVATFYKIGSYTFTVTITDTSGFSATSSVTVSVTATLTSVTVASSAIITGATDQATAYDQFGVALSTQPTWSATGGTINTSGLFTAGSTGGNFTITATNTPNSAQAAVSVVPTSYSGTAGNDAYAIRISPTDNTKEQIFINTPESNSPTYTIVKSQLNSLSFAMVSDGSLTVDFANGNPLPSAGLNTSGGQALIIKGTASGGLAFNISSSQVIYTAALSSPMNFSGLGAVQFSLQGGNNSLTQNAQPSAQLTYNAGSGNNTLTINGGSYTLSSDPALTSGNLTINDNNFITFAVPGFGSGYNARNLAALVLGAGAHAYLLNSSNPTDRTVLFVGQLTVGSGAAVDLQTNTMVVHNSSSAALSPLLGSGIISSSAKNDTTHLTTLGIVANNQSGTSLYTAFDNQPMQLNDVIIKDTYYGDINLDGRVDGSDYTRIDNGYLNHLTGWYNGDLNADNVVNGSDYTLIDNAFNQQGAVLAAQLATAPAKQFATTIPVITPQDDILYEQRHSKRKSVFSNIATA